MALGKILIGRLKQLQFLRSASAKNVMVVMSGTIVAQALPILFFPILSRIYTPSDYGILGLFMSISMLLMVVSNAQLNYAVLIPKEDEEAVRILSVGSMLVFAFSLVILCAVLLFGTLLAAVLKSPGLAKWLLLLPATVFFSGVNVQLSAWFNRLARFKIITSSRVWTSVTTIVFSLGLSFLLEGAGGLIVSYLSGNVVAFLILSNAFRKTSSIKVSVSSFSDIRATLIAYKNFPLYTMPTEVISNFSQQLPLYIFSVFSGAQTVGLFNRSRQILALPLNFVSSSIAEVYKQKSSELFRNNPGELRRLFLKTITYLAAVSIIPFLIIALFSPALFEIAFGASWRDAGVYAQCLVLMYFLRFVVSPTTFNFYLVGKQKLDFVLHIVVSLITSAAIYTGFELFNEEIPALLFFSSAYSVVYIVYGFLSYRFTIIDSR